MIINNQTTGTSREYQTTSAQRYLITRGKVIIRTSENFASAQREFEDARSFYAGDNIRLIDSFKESTKGLI